MKRILTPTPDDNFTSLKPLFGSNSSPPFYDPNDIHRHVWKKGLLGIEDNPKIPTFSKEKINIKECTYCIICHKINKRFVSNLTKKTEILKDIVVKNNIHVFSYKIRNGSNEPEIVATLTSNINKIYVPEDHPNMYHKSKEIFNEYIIIDDKEINLKN
jgi:hypothetical protein